MGRKIDVVRHPINIHILAVPQPTYPRYLHYHHLHSIHHTGLKYYDHIKNPNYHLIYIQYPHYRKCDGVCESYGTATFKVEIKVAASRTNIVDSYKLLFQESKLSFGVD
jgi:hypothetical protein